MIGEKMPEKANRTTVRKVAVLAAAMSELLCVEDLSVHFPTRGGVVRAVDHVSLEIRPGEIIGLVGESASGKTTLGKALMQLVPAPGEIAGGRVLEIAPSDLRQAVSQDEPDVFRPVEKPLAEAAWRFPPGSVSVVELELA